MSGKKTIACGTIVAIGCVGMVVAVLLFGGGIAAALFGSFRSSWALQNGLELARQDPRVVSALGTPIEAGWLISGSLSTSGPSGDADLSIPLKGPQGSARLFVRATKEAGEWRFLQVVVELPSGERLDLTPGASPPAEAAPAEQVVQQAA